jgi:hypothetical protein
MSKEAKTDIEYAMSFIYKGRHQGQLRNNLACSSAGVRA